MRSRNLAGKKFGRWSVVLLHGKRSSVPVWYCRCDCGNESLVLHQTLVAGTSRSCGCLKKELARKRFKKHNPNCTHGHFRGRKRSRTYISYGSMCQRCLNPKATTYAEYGGRGITICQRWLPERKGGGGFKRFLQDVGVRPRGKSLDRKNVNRGYSPKNCIWSTSKTQQGNRRCSPKYRMSRLEILKAACSFRRITSSRNRSGNAIAASIQ